MVVMTRTISFETMSHSDKERIEEVLLDVWGIRKVDINPYKQEAVVSYDEDAASFIDFEQALKDSGYHIDSDDMPMQREDM
ncbi:Copper chaperone CopZ [Alteribacillus persepolensis]|uniref:Copper chaperone CopZ n=1 Tax=Alteribacillus persepolensis TaxID=568899 RepID=A0A1G8DTK2_9BACI|nr:heavy metal-associated domain-containing protein [Alteribacillus persepolensis]SDH60992.1 Copper chaperone CopZ [Alteribacillus persepolensis]